MGLESDSPGFIPIPVPTFPSDASLGNLAILGILPICKNRNNTWPHGLYKGYRKCV